MKERSKDRLFLSEVWIIAILLHVAAAWAVMTIRPLQDFLFGGSERRDLIITPGQLQRIVEGMTENQRERAVQTVTGMQAMLEEMAGIRDRTSAALPGVTGLAELRPPPLRSGQSLTDVYEIAKAIEQKMVDGYRETRAVKMVEARPELTFEEAYDSTTVMRPVRPTLRDDLFTEPITRADDGRLEDFKLELRRSITELQSIENYAARLLEFARDLEQRGTGMTVDLGFGAGDFYELSYSGPTLMPDEIYDSHTYSMGEFRPIPGRKLVGDYEAHTWFYIDTWWLIGPFPNERRRGLDTRFGPEAGVDLDATYIGRDGAELRWEYYKFPTLKVEPWRTDSYVVWYGFTEIYSDREREVWIATGSDDYGKLWVNQELVWTSPTEPKAFKADENVQLITLREGINEILYRCENAGGTMGFALQICTVD